MKPISKIQAIVECKCPRCRKGQIFSGKLYAFKGQTTNEYCPACNLRFEREPGFFYVAMFISYAMNVAEMITIAVATYVLGVDLTYENLWVFVAIVMVGVLFFAPLNYRYSRVFLLHWLTPGLGYVPGVETAKAN